MLIDTHTHLFMPPLSTGTDAVLSRAAASSVTKVIVPAYDIDSWSQVVSLARLPGVYPALGLHPWVADQANSQLKNEPSWLADLSEILASTNPVAIGEIGLDYKIENPNPDQQLLVLKTQLALAVDLDLPVILHCRGAFEELLSAIAPFRPKLRGVLHAFSRSTDVAVRFIDAGLHIALGGAITRPKAKRVRKAAAQLPLDKIVLETDSPSIGLDGILPADTEPCHVLQIAQMLARLRDEQLAVIAEATTANTNQLFGINF